MIAHEGANVTFYELIGVTPSASQDDIKRAYRKKTKTLHPDKVKSQLQARAAKSKGKSKTPGVTVAKPPTQAEVKAAIKEASEKQTRLGVVMNILTGPERARYDHFIANGFPTWKGTGYYYSRYRPGLGTVLVGVFLVGGGFFHYVALYMGWKRQREFIERYIKFARHAAWGENLGIAGVEAGVTAPAPSPPPPTAEDEQGPMMPTNRKQRREQERQAKKESAKEGKRTSRSRAVKSNSGSATPVPQTQPASESGPTGAKKRVVAENGKVLVVDSLGDVYLEQQDEDGNVQEFLLDVSRLSAPAISSAMHRILTAMVSPMRCRSLLFATLQSSDCLSGPSVASLARRRSKRSNTTMMSRMLPRTLLMTIPTSRSEPLAALTLTMILRWLIPLRACKIWPRSPEARVREAAKRRRGTTRSGSSTDCLNLAWVRASAS